MRWILLIVLLVGFVLPIMIRKNRGKNLGDGKVILTPKSIAMESGLSSRLAIILFLLIFVFAGLFIIYLGFTLSANMSNRIFTIVFGGIFILFPGAIIVSILMRFIDVISGNYVVLKDVLKDKEHIVARDTDDSDSFYLYFGNYFERFNKKVPVSRTTFSNAVEGEEFFLVFSKKSVYVFPTRDYELNDFSKIIHIEDLDEYLNEKEFQLEKNTEVIHISKNRIIKDFLKDGHGSTAITFMFTSLFVVGVSIGIISLKELIASIIVVIFAIVWIFLAVVKINYVLQIVWNIRKGNFKIKTDTLVSLDNNIEYKDSNVMTSFKFENYKNIVYAKKKDYNDVLVGDAFYLVFVKGENEPIKAYHMKQSVLEWENLN